MVATGAVEAGGKASTEGLEFVDLPVDEHQALASDSKRLLPVGPTGCPRIRRRIGSFVRLANLFQSEAELLGVADKANTREVLFLVGAVATRGAGRFAEKFFALVEAEGVDGNASGAGEFADAHTGQFTEELSRREAGSSVLDLARLQANERRWRDAGHERYVDNSLYYF